MGTVSGNWYRHMIEVTEVQLQRLKSLVNNLPRYRRCKGILKAYSSYCCLGVACELYGVQWVNHLSDDLYTTSINDDRFNLNLLPTEVMNYYGFTHQAGFDIPVQLVMDVLGLQDRLRYRELHNKIPYRLDTITLSYLNDDVVVDHVETARVLDAFIEKYVTVKQVKAEVDG